MCGERVIDVIVPTPVGVNRQLPFAVGRGENCPHARGGEPIAWDVIVADRVLSPRPWG